MYISLVIEIECLKINRLVNNIRGKSICFVNSLFSAHCWNSNGFERNSLQRNFYSDSFSCDWKTRQMHMVAARLILHVNLATTNMIYSRTSLMWTRKGHTKSVHNECFDKLPVKSVIAFLFSWFTWRNNLAAHCLLGGFAYGNVSLPFTLSRMS